jgi:hypothetical protein
MFLLRPFLNLSIEVDISDSLDIENGHGHIPDRTDKWTPKRICLPHFRSLSSPDRMSTPPGTLGDEAFVAKLAAVAQRKVRLFTFLFAFLPAQCSTCTYTPSSQRVQGISIAQVFANYVSLYAGRPASPALTLAAPLMPASSSAQSNRRRASPPRSLLPAPPAQLPLQLASALSPAPAVAASALVGPAAFLQLRQDAALYRAVEVDGPKRKGGHRRLCEERNTFLHFCDECIRLCVARFSFCLPVSSNQWSVVLFAFWLQAPRRPGRRGWHPANLVTVGEAPPRHSAARVPARPEVLPAGGIQQQRASARFACLRLCHLFFRSPSLSFFPFLSPHFGSCPFSEFGVIIANRRAQALRSREKANAIRLARLEAAEEPSNANSSSSSSSSSGLDHRRCALAFCS